MARNIYTKKDFCFSRSLHNLSAEAEVFFHRLRANSSVKGLFVVDLDRLASLCFPLRRDLDSDIIAEWLDELQGEDIVRFYGVNGVLFGFFTNERKHNPKPWSEAGQNQYKDHDNSRIPEPPLAATDYLRQPPVFSIVLWNQARTSTLDQDASLNLPFSENPVLPNLEFPTNPNHNPNLDINPNLAGAGDACASEQGSAAEATEVVHTNGYDRMTSAELLKAFRNAEAMGDAALVKRLEEIIDARAARRRERPTKARGP